MLFKKGDILNCNNYRGISVINCIAKKYVYVLFNDYHNGLPHTGNRLGLSPKEVASNIFWLFALLLICVLRKDGNSL